MTKSQKPFSSELAFILFERAFRSERLENAMEKETLTSDLTFTKRKETNVPSIPLMMTLAPFSTIKKQEVILLGRVWLTALSRSNCTMSKIVPRKKALLRKRKRRTAHGVSSTPSAVLSRGGGVTPSVAGGYLLSGTGVPPRRDLEPVTGVPPGRDLGPAIGVPERT